MKNRFFRDGDSVGEALQAAYWNDTARVVEVALGTGEPLPAQLSPNGKRLAEYGAVRAELENDTTGDSDYLDVMGIAAPGITPTEANGDFHNRVILQGGTPVQGAFALADSALRQQDVGWGRVAGVTSCRLFVETNGDWMDRADIDSADATRLRATPNGSAQILWKDTGTNAEVDAIVRLGLPQNVTYPGKSNGAITAGGTGTVTIWKSGATTNWDLTGVHLDWMHMSTAITSGKEVLVTWFPNEARWRVVAAECET